MKFLMTKSFVHICWTVLQKILLKYPNSDRHGRKRSLYNTQEICNYNSLLENVKETTPFLHICILCKNKDYSLPTCFLNFSRSNNAAFSTINQKWLPVQFHHAPQLTSNSWNNNFKIMKIKTLFQFHHWSILYLWSIYNSLLKAATFYHIKKRSKTYVEMTMSLLNFTENLQVYSDKQLHP